MSKEKVQIYSRLEWRNWLVLNHTRKQGVWLVTIKKHHDNYVSYEDIVEEALCFGWVDSLPRRLDDDRTMLWLAPRKPGSNWSKPNKERVERLIRAGLMTLAGLEKVELAKQNGSWTALDAVEDLQIPQDLEAALRSSPPAEENFGAFPRSVKRGILEWITNAKRPETRARRIEETARLAKENIRANQWRK